MRNAYLLCKLQIQGIFRVRVQKTGTVLTLLLYALAGIGIVAYSATMAHLMNTAGFGDLSVIVMLVAASMVALVVTVMKGGSMLLCCKDYDFIAALPMTAAQHVGGRLMSMYLGEMCFFIALLLPAGVVYARSAGIVPLLAVVAVVPLAPLIPLALGTAVGALVRVISARSRHAWLWAILISLAATLGLLALSTGLSFNASQMEDAQIFALGRAAQDAVVRFYPPARALQSALQGSFADLVLFALGSVLVSALVIGLLARYYGAIQARLSGRSRTADFHLGAMKARRPLAALYVREVKHIFSVVVYAMNVLIGPILYVVAGVAVWFMGAGRIMGVLGLMGGKDYVLMAVPLIGAMVVSMTTASASAESLEGKARWIVQAAPVSRGTYRSAKLLASVTLQGVGALMGGALLAVVLGAGYAWGALFALMPLAWAVLTSTCGLALNLKWPRYDWVNEQQVIKQGLPVLLGILFDMLGVVGAGALTIWLFDSAQAVLWGLTGLAALAGGVWWAWLCRKQGG